LANLNALPDELIESHIREGGSLLHVLHGIQDASD